MSTATITELNQRVRTLDREIAGKQTALDERKNELERAGKTLATLTATEAAELKQTTAQIDRLKAERMRASDQAMAAVEAHAAAREGGKRITGRAPLGMTIEAAERLRLAALARRPERSASRSTDSGRACSHRRA